MRSATIDVPRTSADHRLTRAVFAAVVAGLAVVLVATPAHADDCDDENSRPRKDCTELELVAADLSTGDLLSRFVRGNDCGDRGPSCRAPKEPKPAADPDDLPEPSAPPTTPPPAPPVELPLPSEAEAAHAPTSGPAAASVESTSTVRSDSSTPPRPEPKTTSRTAPNGPAPTVATPPRTVATAPRTVATLPPTTPPPEQRFALASRPNPLEPESPGGPTIALLAQGGALLLGGCWLYLIALRRR